MVKSARLAETHLVEEWQENRNVTLDASEENEREGTKRIRGRRFSTYPRTH